MDTIPTPRDDEQASSLPPAPPPPRRRRWSLAAAIVAGVLVLTAVGLLIVDRSPHAAGGTGSASSPTATPVSPTPTDLKATAAGPFAVVLRWRAGSDGTVDVSRYAIFRNGHVLGSATDGDLHYVDKTALPSQRYEYVVQAVGTDGTLSKDARIKVKTPKAPLSSARLQGVFNMKFHITSSYGVHGFDDKTEGWRFTPKCTVGACPTHLRDIHWNAFATDLHRSGVTYSSTFSMRGYMVCAGTPDTTSMHITLHVTKAKVSNDVWLATAVSGTMTVSSAAAFGCTSSGITYTFTGELPGA